MPLAQSLGEPGGHTMIEPWLMMNWHRTMDWLLLAPTLSAQEALDWGLLNKVVPRDDLEDTVEEMARKIAQIPLTTLMAVKNNVKRAWELMGMRVHLQVSHILTNMVGAASDVQARRAELMQSGLKPRDFVEGEGEQAPSADHREACCPPHGGARHVAEHHRARDARARTRIRSAHHRGGGVARRVQALDHPILLVENLRVLVGDHASACPNIGGQHPGRVIRVLGPAGRSRHWADTRIAEAVVVGRLAPAEVGIEAFGREFVEPPNGVLSSSAGTSIWRARSAMVSPRMTAPRSISSSGIRRFFNGLALDTYLPT